MKITRVIGAEVRTVGELQEALADTNPNTVIRWHGTDSEGDSIPVTAAEVDASPYTAEIRLGE